jgi:hypothetical protein
MDLNNLAPGSIPDVSFLVVSLYPPFPFLFLFALFFNLFSPHLTYYFGFLSPLTFIHFISSRRAIHVISNRKSKTTVSQCPFLMARKAETTQLLV